MDKNVITLPDESLAILRSLVGSTWQAFGGRNMPPRLSQPFAVFITTDEGDITIHSEAGWYREENEDVTYAELTVAHGASDVARSKANGGWYPLSRGEKIVDVTIIRDTITYDVDDTRLWSTTIDIGIIFILNHSAIAIMGDGYSDEMLIVRHAKSIENLTLPSFSDRYHDRLGEKTVISRTFVPVPPK
ncbi:MAG: hypothetical protein LBH13_06690 [Cellulomonadaceae bacterium]|jgi:hypothetical protein|nr:hypothetical protein [Cellulomonadaceae bacterium]